MKMNNIYLSILVVLLASCTTDYLDEQDPNRVTTGNFWKTEADLKAALATCYQPMNSTFGYYGSLGIHTHEVRTENYGWLVGPYDSYDVEIFQNTPNHSFEDGLWGSNYRGINYANQVIQYGGAMDIDENVKGKYVAEAQFLRGLYYFLLVIDYGSVPIHSKVTETKEEFTLPRSPIEEVWKQVTDDLTKAAAGLPVTRPSDNSQAGRATKGAALAYLGRAYLYQKNYAKAQEVLKSVVDNESAYHYGLRPNFSELFDGQHENETSGIIEGVFELQRKAVSGYGEWDIYTSLLGWVFGPTEVGAWEFGYPRKALLDSMLAEPAANGGFDPRATTTLAWDYPENVFFQKDFHTFFGPNKICNKKNQNWWNASEGDGKSELDEYGVRYADVLLMLAEAYTMQSNVTAASPLVKRIRDRAKLADKNFSGYTQDQMMAEIRRQRNLEFAREGLRWYDLQRWGLFETVIKNSTEPGKENYTSKFQYFPIPQSELNSNPNMTQNDAW